MWRWSILAALLLAATLGASGCARGLDACIGGFEDQPPSKNFHRLYSSRLDARFGETTQLVMTVENTREHAQTLIATRHPLVLFVVVSPDCRVYWSSPLSQGVTENHLDFRPYEAKEFVHEWSFTNHWGEMVPPGDYHFYGFMAVIEEPVNDDEDPRSGTLVASSIMKVEGAHIIAARPAYPPTPADPSSCGEPADETRVRQVISKHSRLLGEWASWSMQVINADLLDESRHSTGARGIRVVAEQWRVNLAEKLEAERELLPECLEGVPVQLVVRPDE